MHGIQLAVQQLVAQGHEVIELDIERDVREFAEQGVCVADWARERGFPPCRVYDVLNRRSECTRGVAHAIAVELGLKRRPAEAPAV